MKALGFNPRSISLLQEFRGATICALLICRVSQDPVVFFRDVGRQTRAVIELHAVLSKELKVFIAKGLV